VSAEPAGDDVRAAAATKSTDARVLGSVAGPYGSRLAGGGGGGGPNHVSGDRLDRGADGGGYGGLQWNGLARDNRSKLKTTTMTISTECTKK